MSTLANLRDRLNGYKRSQPFCDETWDRAKKDFIAAADEYYVAHMDGVEAEAIQNIIADISRLKCKTKLAIVCDPNMNAIQQYSHICFALKTIACEAKEPTLATNDQHVIYFKNQFNAEEIANISANNRVTCSQFDCVANGLSGSPFHVIMYYGTLNPNQLDEIMLYLANNGWLFCLRGNAQPPNTMKSVYDFDIKSENGMTYRFRALKKDESLLQQVRQPESKEEFTIVAEGKLNQYGVKAYGGCTMFCMETVLRVLAGCAMNGQLIDDVLNFLAPIEASRGERYTDIEDVRTAVTRYGLNLEPLNLEHLTEYAPMPTFLQVDFAQHKQITNVIEAARDPAMSWTCAVVTAGIYSFALFLGNNGWRMFDSHGVPTQNRTSGAVFMGFQTKDKLDKYIFDKFGHGHAIGVMVFRLSNTANPARLRQNPSQNEIEEMTRQSRNIN